jgi:hypothetical protein
MTNSENKKIAILLFHVVALILLFISVSLKLNEIFSQGTITGNIANCFEPSFESKFAQITILIALISWILMLRKWIKSKKSEFYLKTIFFTKIFLIIGLIILLFF